MFQQLSSFTYLSLTMINTLIGIIGTFSLGLIHGHSKSFCPFMILDYPDNVSLPMDNCHLYESSLKLIKLVIILSTCYNVYLIYIFFSATVLPIFILEMLLNFVFWLIYSNEKKFVHFLGMLLVSFNFIIIVVHAILVSFGSKKIQCGGGTTDWNNNQQYRRNNPIQYHVDIRNQGDIHED